MIYWVLTLSVLVCILFIAGIFRNRFLTERKLKEIRMLWSKPKNIYRSFKLINSYLNTFETKNDASAADLDLNDVFCFIDRTNSKPGQQYLYKQLHTSEVCEEYLTALEQRINKFNQDADLRELTELKLTDLNNNEAYYLPELFSKLQHSIFKRFTTFYIKIGLPLLVSLIIAFLIIPNQVYFLLISVCVIANVVIHMSNKSKMMAYTHSLPQVLLLHSVSTWLFNHDLLIKRDTFKQSLMNVAKLKKSLGFINIQNKTADDPTNISYLFSEWFKMFLLIEPLNFIYSIDKVNKYRDDIRMLFECVAEIDVAISIQSVRTGAPYYCVPEFSKVNERVIIEELYHPLIENCVPNSIDIDNRQGVLITGSNMSGKTTFIRTLAINIILSQTINTSFSKKYHAPVLKTFTSINMSDDLGEQTSYFQAEAISIREIIRDCSENRIVNNLVIIDEIFRGTNTIERIAAAKAVLSYFIKNNIFVLVSTHDLELAELLGNDYKVFSFEEIIGDDRLIFDYKIKEGLLKNKNGIAVLKGLGYPQSIIDEASIVSSQLRERYNL
ncbi:MAG: hypothetical protein ABI203_05400 [Mucilaginibacter sp.]